MSDREEFEKAMRKVYVGYCFVYLGHVAGYTEDCIDDAWTGWQAATASMQAKLDEANANIAALKSVGLEPKFVWHKVENEDECDVFDFNDIEHTGCKYCINLYTAEQINKIKDKLDTPLMCEVCGNKHTFIYLNQDGTMQIARDALKGE